VRAEAADLRHVMAEDHPPHLVREQVLAVRPGDRFPALVEELAEVGGQ